MTPMLTGPLGQVPVDHDRRLGAVVITEDAVALVRLHGLKLRSYLPPGSFVISSTFNDYDREWRIVFHKPSLRQIPPGQHIPRWTHRFRDETDDTGWWEELA